MISVQEFERVTEEPLQAVRAAVALVILHGMTSSGLCATSDITIKAAFRYADEFLERMVKTP